MAVTSLSGSESPDVQDPLLCDAVEGSVDYKSRPVYRSNTGAWRSAGFIIGVEVAERFAYGGIQSSLITYLTGPLGQATATAAENVNVWSGTSLLLPLLGAFVADSFFGRYRTIVVSSLINIVGLGLLTVSAMLPYQVALFFFSLYLVALGQGGHRPCVQAFGADQFDGQDPEECKAKSSFFNWWFFFLNVSFSLAVLTVNYVQDNLNWALGFGIPCIVMVIALFIFLLGTKTYRFSVQVEERSAFLRIGQVFVTTFRNWRTSPSAIALEEEARGALSHHNSEQFKFLDKALLAQNGLKKNGKVYNFSEVEEAKAILRLIPVSATCLVYAVVSSQTSTFFTKQGLTMDRSISTSFDIPAASLQSFISITVILFIPVYDSVFVPLARTLTRKPSGITMLQRIGSGMFLSALSMAVAALVEMKRLEIAREYGLVDMPTVTVPMSVWWLVPQYILFGVADVFTMVGLQEFFYDQVPCELRSVGLALYLGIFGVGSLISSFLVSAIDKATGGQGQDSWFANNLNRGHLDCFYWLLAGISTIQLFAYLYFTKNYVYTSNRRGTI